jgi:hypothetical protein
LSSLAVPIRKPLTAPWSPDGERGREVAADRLAAVEDLALARGRWLLGRAEGQHLCAWLGGLDAGRQQAELSHEARGDARPAVGVLGLVHARVVERDRSVVLPQPAGWVVDDGASADPRPVSPVRVEEFTFSAVSVGKLAVTLLQLIRERALALPDDEALIDELRNVRLRESSPGVYRLDHDRGRHDDRAVALALAATALIERPTAEPARWASARSSSTRPSRTRSTGSSTSRSRIGGASTARIPAAARSRTSRVRLTAPSPWRGCSRSGRPPAQGGADPSASERLAVLHLQVSSASFSKDALTSPLAFTVTWVIRRTTQLFPPPLVVRLKRLTTGNDALPL